MRKYTAVVKLNATVTLVAESENEAYNKATDDLIIMLNEQGITVGSNCVIAMSDQGPVDPELKLRAEPGLEPGNTVQSLGPTESTPITEDIPAVKQLRKKKEV